MEQTTAVEVIPASGFETLNLDYKAREHGRGVSRKVAAATIMSGSGCRNEGIYPSNEADEAAIVIHVAWLTPSSETATSLWELGVNGGSGEGNQISGCLFLTHTLSPAEAGTAHLARFRTGFITTARRSLSSGGCTGLGLDPFRDDLQFVCCLVGIQGLWAWSAAARAVADRTRSILWQERVRQLSWQGFWFFIRLTTMRRICSSSSG